MKTARKKTALSSLSKGASSSSTDPSDNTASKVTIPGIDTGISVDSDEYEELLDQEYQVEEEYSPSPYDGSDSDEDTVIEEDIPLSSGLHPREEPKYIIIIH